MKDWSGDGERVEQVAHERESRKVLMREKIAILEVSIFFIFNFCVYLDIVVIY